MTGFPDRIIFIDGVRREGEVTVAMPLTYDARAFVHSQHYRREVDGISVVETMERVGTIFSEPAARGILLDAENLEEDLRRLTRLALRSRVS